MNIKGVIGLILIIAGLLGLFAWGKSMKNNHLIYFRDTKIACLVNGHQNLAFHVHPKMKITVDGANEVIPANVGIIDTCMSEVHTHDDTGEIHVESFSADRLAQLNLASLYEVWGINSEREGYNLEIYLDGQLKNSVTDVPIIDHSQIEMRYTTKK